MKQNISRFLTHTRPALELPIADIVIPMPTNPFIVGAVRQEAHSRQSLYKRLLAMNKRQKCKMNVSMSSWQGYELESLNENW